MGVVSVFVSGGPQYEKQGMGHSLGKLIYVRSKSGVLISFEYILENPSLPRVAVNHPHGPPKRYSLLLSYLIVLLSRLFMHI